MRKLLTLSLFAALAIGGCATRVDVRASSAQRARVQRIIALARRAAVEYSCAVHLQHKGKH